MSSKRFLLFCLAGLPVALAAPASAQPTLPQPQTGEQQVNDGETAFDQDDPTVAMDALGNFIVAWESASFPFGNGVFARRYNASGAPVASDFLVNNNVDGNQSEPDAAMSGDGRFVIVYESDGGAFDTSGDGIHARLYTGAGSPTGGEFPVNKIRDNDQVQPAVSMIASGAFAVAWETEVAFGTFGFDSRREIRVLRFNNVGNPIDGDELIISQNTADGSQSRNPDIAVQSNGALMVVVWQRSGDIWARRYNGATGAPLAGEFQVNDDDSGTNECPSIGMDAAGNFVIAWERDVAFGSEGVFARRFNADGTAIAGQFLVNTFTNDDQEDPATSVRTDSSGNFVIIWESDGQDGSGEGVFGQFYDSAGNPVPAANGEFMVNVTTSRDQDDPAVAMAPNGNFAVAWESRQRETRGLGDDGVYVRLFGPPGAPGSGPACEIAGDGAACPGAQDITYTVSETTGAPTPAFAWSVMGDASIDGATDGSSVNVDVDPTCGMFVLMVTVTDATGATETCSLSVSVEDGTNPVLTLPSDALMLECPADTSVGALGSATATDNCPATVTVSSTDVRTEGCGGTHSIVRTWTATDACGNSVSDDQMIQVLDTIDPVVTPPMAMEVECGMDTSPAATGTATGTDACGTVQISSTDSFAPACGATGVITRTWTGIDECSRQGSAVQIITIVDTTEPTIACPVDVTILRGESIDPVDTGNPAGSDACGTVTFGFVDSVEPAPSPIFEIITRTWTATDECGLTSTCDQVITVVDYCVWDQGEWDGVDGQTSEIGTAVEMSRTADDFCLKEGYVYEIERLCVMMITDSDELDATLQLYHDCNGCPGEPVDCGLANASGYTIVARNVDSEGRDLVQFDFDFTARTEVDEYGDEVEIPALWLKGGCYWASPVGIGDGTGYDRYFWATAGDDLTSAIPKTQAGPFKIDGWERVDDLNVSCRNFAFRLHGEKCCILQDNGGPADDVNGAQNTSAVGCANADDFALPRCSEATEICFYSTYVWTNCDCSRTKLELIDDDCGAPMSTDFGTRNGNSSYLADKCVDMGRTVTFQGEELTLYRVEWHNLGVHVGHSRGRNGWASVHVQGSGSFNELGVVAFADRCGTDCDASFAPGHVICPPDEILDWTSVDRDYAFCIATRGGEDNVGPMAPIAVDEPEGCAADFNGDGLSTITDLLGFMAVWFEGCQ